MMTDAEKAQALVDQMPDTWRGVWCGRDEAGTINTVARRPQIGRAEEPLDEDDKEVRAYFAEPLPAADPIAELRTELDALKASTASRLDAIEAGSLNALSGKTLSR